MHKAESKLMYEHASTINNIMELCEIQRDRYA